MMRAMGHRAKYFLHVHIPEKYVEFPGGDSIDGKFLTA